MQGLAAIQLGEGQLGQRAWARQTGIDLGQQRGFARCIQQGRRHISQALSAGNSEAVAKIWRRVVAFKADVGLGQPRKYRVIGQDGGPIGRAMGTLAVAIEAGAVAPCPTDDLVGDWPQRRHLPQCVLPVHGIGKLCNGDGGRGQTAPRQCRPGRCHDASLQVGDVCECPHRRGQSHFDCCTHLNTVARIGIGVE